MKYSVKELAKIFPLGAVEENCIFTKWGDLTLAFEITLPEIFTLNARIEEGVEMGDYRELVCPPPLRRNQLMLEFRPLPI